MDDPFGILVYSPTVAQRVRRLDTTVGAHVAPDELAVIDTLDTGRRGGANPKSITLAERGAEIPET